jgi:hypothetical protein
MPEPAIIPEWRRARSVRHGQKSITMLRPQCAICQRADNAPVDWYVDCPHDPYVTMIQQEYDEPQMEPVLDADGEATGEQRIVGVEKKVRFIPHPNRCEVAESARINSGNGVYWARQLKGKILPSELRNNLYPNGIADTCQFRDCHQQTGLVEYAGLGMFCREIEAKMVMQDQNRTSVKAMEIGWNRESSEKRESQIAGIVVQKVQA